MNIERVPYPGKKATGRWCHYFLRINGKSLGTVRATWAFSHDKLAGRGQQRAAGYEAGGRCLESPRAAEIHLVSRERTLIQGAQLTEAEVAEALEALEV